VNFERSARPHRHGDGVTGCVGPGPAVGAELESRFRVI
jgi:hypothetical protein